MNRLLIVSAITVIALIAIGPTIQSVQSQLQRGNDAVGGDRTIKQVIAAAPIAIVGDNIYVAWPTNTSGNDEVNFRASTDGGTTFADKINLSNSTDADSQDVEIAADGDNVVITWWERNATSNEPVVRISTDNGETFSSLLRLAANGTIGGEGG